MADEPMTDERLAKIRARAKASWQMLEHSDTISVEVALTRDALTLVAEIDRLRGAIDTARQLIERLEEYAELPIAHPLNTAIDDWLRSIGV